MTKIGYIYMITNPVNKLYIGSTSRDINIRWKCYQRLECKSQRLLYNSLVKYGFTNHKFEIIWIGEISELLQKEAILGNFYNVLDKEIGLNLNLPKINDIYQSVSQETRDKISKALKGRKYNKHKIKSTRSRTSKHNNNISKSLCKPILQYSLDGDFIREYPSTKFIKENLKIFISDCIGKNQMRGFQWRYKTENYSLKIDKYVRSTKRS